MPEILSQQEIDSLLSGISPSESRQTAVAAPEKKTEKEVATFDFRLPHRLSKNQLRTLQAVHESFGESMSSYFVSRLQTNVAISVTLVDQLFYSEYVLSIPSPSCLFIFRIVESDALAILELSPQLVLAMVSRMLGGSSETVNKPRLITKIEQNIVKGMVQRALSDLQKAWKSIASLTFVQERYESEGDFAQIAPTTEIVLVVSFEVAISDQKYLMNVCFPTFALDEVLAKLNTQNFDNLAGAARTSEWSGEILKRLGVTAVPAICVLGTTTVTLRELLALEKGDVIKTDIPIDDEVRIVLGGTPRMWGRPGISNGRVATKITKTATELVTEN
jgi:flagellar motor switch protein FliM